MWFLISYIKDLGFSCNANMYFYTWNRPMLFSFLAHISRTTNISEALFHFFLNRFPVQIRSILNKEKPTKSPQCFPTQIISLKNWLLKKMPSEVLAQTTAVLQPRLRDSWWDDSRAQQLELSGSGWGWLMAAAAWKAAFHLPHVNPLPWLVLHTASKRPSRKCQKTLPQQNSNTYPGNGAIDKIKFRRFPTIGATQLLFSEDSPAALKDKQGLGFTSLHPTPFQ